MGVDVTALRSWLFVCRLGTPVKLRNAGAHMSRGRRRLPLWRANRRRESTHRPPSTAEAPDRPQLPHFNAIMRFPSKWPMP